MATESEPQPAPLFPPTRRSAVVALSSGDPAERARAFETVVAAYWKPVYKYLRLRWRVEAEQGRDWTQAFFTRALEKDFLRNYRPERASFRTYLRTCLDRFVMNERKAARRLKRGGAVTTVSLDFDGAEAELGRRGRIDTPPHEQLFHQEWVRSLFGLAIQRLRAEWLGRERRMALQVFERYDLHDQDGPRPTYDQLGLEFGVPTTTVTNHLAAVRRDLRRIVLEQLRELTVNDQEFRREARALLGVEPPVPS